MSDVKTPVSVEEYLNTSCKPACDYIDGVLRQKAWPTRNHSRAQTRLTMLLYDLPGFEVAPEVTVRIRPGKYLVPDIIVQQTDRIQDPYPLEPVYLCAEVLTPTDRMSEMVGKCEDYYDWGVKTTWIIDPDAKRAWAFQGGHRLQEIEPSGTLTAGEISIPCADLFAGI